VPLFILKFLFYFILFYRLEEEAAATGPSITCMASTDAMRTLLINELGYKKFSPLIFLFGLCHKLFGSHLVVLETRELGGGHARIGQAGHAREVTWS
jgi:hypothetical protein